LKLLKIFAEIQIFAVLRELGWEFPGGSVGFSGVSGFAAGEFFCKRIAMNSKAACCPHQVSLIPVQDFGNKAILKLLHRFREENPPVDHFSANGLESFLEPGCMF
jgi:hypothetical protein